MRLQALLDDVGDIGLLETSGDLEVDVTSVTHDSRRVEPGALFACVPGLRFDGHDYASKAVAAGAVALLVERTVALGRDATSAARGSVAAASVAPVRVAQVGVAQIRVAQVRAALGPVSAARLGWPSHSIPVFGVTGTNGKTTTTYLLEAIGRVGNAKVGVIGTTGARIGGIPVPLEHTTPEAPELQVLLARMRDEGVTMVAMEVSSHALAQHRVDGTRYAAVAFTNLSHDHLDYHGTLDDYFDAKARLFDPTFTAAAAIGVDDEYGRRLESKVREAGLPVVTYALDRHADLVATDVRDTEGGTTFVLDDHRTGRSFPVESALVGRVNVLNSLAAAATASLGGYDLEVIAEALGAVGAVPGRLERVGSDQPFMVFVDYAHTPDALAHALATARARARGRRVLAVVGCGGDRDRSKRPKMGEVVSQQADLAIITSDNPRSESAAAIADEMLAGVAADALGVRVELDRRRAIRLALREARPGDVVLIAGKGHETSQTSGRTTIAFDDRVVAREELEALR